MQKQGEQPVGVKESFSFNKGLFRRFVEKLIFDKPKEELALSSAVAFLSFGLALMCVGYIIPRDYVFDPSLPAREMEQIEIHYAKLSYYLDVSILVGIGFIAVGGIIASGLTVYWYVSAKGRVYRKEDRQDLNLLDDSQTEMTTYGTTNGAEQGK